FARPASVLEPTHEDYGQVAVYRGTIDGQRARTRFDNQWAFEANRPVLVDGNTAMILGESWLRRHFEVRGDRSQHFGGFTATPPAVQYEPWETDHEYEEYDVAPFGQPGEPVVRRRGIQPLATPFFLNGLRQQQAAAPSDGRSRSTSRRASPVYDHRGHASPQQSRSLPGPPNPMPRAALRDHPAAFPRLSSFSISHSNVRAEGASMRSAPSARSGLTAPISQPQQQQHPEPGADSRFVMPAGRVVPPYKNNNGSPVAPRFSITSAAVQTPQQQQQQQPQLSAGSIGSTPGNQQLSAGSIGSTQGQHHHQQTSSPSIRSGSTASPVATIHGSLAPPPSRLHVQPFSSAPQSSTRSRMSPSPPRHHSPQSVAAAASMS
ncbi:hypothetical protein IWW50_002038, partial [Coemansia erecta]